MKGVGGRSKQYLINLMLTRGQWTLKEEALYRTVWRTRLGRGCGPAVRLTTELITE